MGDTCTRTRFIVAVARGTTVLEEARHDDTPGNDKCSHAAQARRLCHDLCINTISGKPDYFAYTLREPIALFQRKMLLLASGRDSRHAARSVHWTFDFPPCPARSKRRHLAS